MYFRFVLTSIRFVYKPVDSRFKLVNVSLHSVIKHRQNQF